MCISMRSDPVIFGHLQHVPGKINWLVFDSIYLRVLGTPWAPTQINMSFT